HHTRISINRLIEPVARVKETQASVCSNVRDYRLDVDLHLQLGHGESFDNKSRRHGRYPFEETADRVVDGDAIGPIGNIGRDFADVLEARSGFLEQLRDVAHGLSGLGGSILRGYQAVVQIQAGLATYEEAVASLDHHTHVII